MKIRKKFDDAGRHERRLELLMKRDDMIVAHRNRKRSIVQWHTTAFDNHSSDRQRARYARQIAAGQIRNAVCVR